ncbi:pantoate--beta-alanine ligase [Halalkalibacillus halophilus]|uniref:pantoate--beta-alanine ligase n=1 Tax=Halalkalibacillus halophilus TaxID=392827 RepID=UPI000413A7C7|nr:pantoate--beta-alanine ligase [Halalkalibacillus halophilus]
MNIIETIDQMNNEKYSYQQEGKSVGFVPTMGYLHEGHLKLIEESNKNNDITVVSIFVNPKQFNQQSDLDGYPRDITRDQELLKQYDVDYIFYPDSKEMYPTSLTIDLSLSSRGNVLCGKTRPGHFEGVLLVLSKLFHIVSPTHAYFGLKDAQQVAVVKALVEDLNFNIQIIPVPTVREKDGLAKSSRNVNLEPLEREEASHLIKALYVGRKCLIEHGLKRNEIIRSVNDYLNKHVTGQIDYVDCLSYPTLSNEITENHAIIIAVAVKYKKARLIDNFILNSNGDFIYKERN